MKIRIFILMGFMLLCSLSRAESTTPREDWFEKGNSAYQEQNYQQAIDEYLKAENEGWSSAELYFNLGNSYFRLDKWAEAILYYERAKRIDPGDEDILINLEHANLKIKDQIEEAPIFFTKVWWNWILGLFSIDGWGWMSILFFVFFLAFLGLFFVLRTDSRRKLWLGLSSVLLLLTVLAFVFAQVRINQLERTDEAIIFTESVVIKSSPEESSQDLYRVHRGIKVIITDTEGEWVHIEWADGKGGWVQKRHLEII